MFKGSIIVTLVFIILKLAGTIVWPWMWVFSPLLFVSTFSMIAGRVFVHWCSVAQLQKMFDKIIQDKIDREKK